MSTNKQEENYSSKLTVLAFVVVGLSIIVFVPAILPLANHCFGWNLGSQNQIGDAFGGMTAPFLNLLGAVIVYLAFQKQVEANELQRQALADEQVRFHQQREFEILLNILQTLEKETKVDAKNFKEAISEIVIQKVKDISKEGQFIPKCLDWLHKRLGPNFWGTSNRDIHRDNFRLLVITQSRRGWMYSGNELYPIPIKAFFGGAQIYYLNEYKKLLKYSEYWIERLDKAHLQSHDTIYLCSKMSDFYWERVYLEPAYHGAFDRKDEEYLRICSQKNRIENLLKKLGNGTAPHTK